MTMHKLGACLAALAATLAIPAHAAATVEVGFFEPQKFADIGFNAVDRERVLNSLARFVKTLGEQQLPEGQTLKVEITNVNLAGEIRPTRNGDLRIMRGKADWPEVELRYTLTAGTQTLKSGQAKVHDMAYLQGMRTADIGGELGYEKRMLRRWFTETFGTH